MKLRIVLMGTGEFALPSFRALIESSDHEVVGVYTQPDRTGRGHHRHVNKVKSLAQEYCVPVFQPQRINTTESLDELKRLNADVFIVAAYGQILKPELLSIPRLGAFNLHGSLLPKHRGAAPVQYSIWKGDEETGVTIFQIEPSLDSGPIVGVVRTKIAAKETSGELMLRLAELCVPETIAVVNRLSKGIAQFVEQDPALVTLAPKICKEEGVIDWSRTATEIDCHVRAMQPWPKASAWLHIENRPPLRCILLDVHPKPNGKTKPAGSIQIIDRQLCVQTAAGLLIVNRIQPEGKQAMDGVAFANGYGLANAAFSSSDDATVKISTEDEP